MVPTPGVLVLEDGSEFEGTLFGARENYSYGEVVFNTSMTGYQEILTDPSYFGQIVCMTVPHIGNTGINPMDVESSRAWCAGFVVHELCETPSSWRSTRTLEDYLHSYGILGLFGVNTRALTRHIRTYGTIRGLILPTEQGQDYKKRATELFVKLPSFEGRDLIAEVSTAQPYFWKKPETKNPYRVVALDFGVKWNLLRNLEQRGCEVEVVPAKTSAQDILARNPQGVFLSNGPGDPKAAIYAAHTVRELLGKVPIFGVCMGHQVLALAVGARTYKLKFGHRGGNQPVLDQTSRHVEISSHNHGYAVDAASLPSDIEVTHLNLNDKTVEGLRVKGANAFSVQYHPEASPGPHDSILLFDQFVENMKKNVSKIS